MALPLQRSSVVVEIGVTGRIGSPSYLRILDRDAAA